MDPREIRLLQDLLRRERVLSLAVLVDQAPILGLLPFVAREDLGAAIVHASRLARHTSGLADGAPFGVLIHAADTPASDVRQIPRVSLEGTVRPIAAGSPAWDEARALYLGRFPESAPIFELGDFGLYELRFSTGRLVGGFARAIDLTAATLAEAAAARP